MYPAKAEHPTSRHSAELTWRSISDRSKPLVNAPSPLSTRKTPLSSELTPTRLQLKLLTVRLPPPPHRAILLLTFLNTTFRKDTALPTFSSFNSGRWALSVAMAVGTAGSVPAEGRSTRTSEGTVRFLEATLFFVLLLLYLKSVETSSVEQPRP